MTIFYFTSTGNSLYVARSIGGTLLSIPKELKAEKKEYEDDSIGFCFPCFYCDTPELVKTFIKQHKFSAQYLFAIITFGSMTMGATNTLYKLGKSCGIEFNYINRIMMIDNYLPLFDIHKQKLLKPQKTIESHLETITHDVISRKHHIYKVTQPKYLFSLLLTKIEYAICHNKDNKYYVTDQCIACGWCKAICPKGNIEITDLKPHFLHNCCDCFACIHICPQNALHIKGERSPERYRNPNITTRDLLQLHKI